MLKPARSRTREGGGPGEVTRIFGPEPEVWYRYESASGICRIGVTDCFAGILGRVTYVEPGEVGMGLEDGDEVASLETERGNYSLRAPAPGVLVETNRRLVDDPDLANRDPAGAGWIADYRPDYWPPV